MSPWDGIQAGELVQHVRHGSGAFGVVLEGPALRVGMVRVRFIGSEAPQHCWITSLIVVDERTYCTALAAHMLGASHEI